MSNGKGDRQRPVDKETYDKNYEEIDWSDKSKSELELITKLQLPAIRLNGKWQVVEV